MQISSIFTLSFFLLFGANSNQRAYQRLEKKYIKDKTECIALAKKMISKNKKLPEPYYFLALINFESYKNETTIKKQYRYLNRVLSSAIKLKKIDLSEMYQKEKWFSLKAEITSEVPLLINKLEKEFMDDNAESLLHKANRFDKKIEESMDSVLFENHRKKMATRFINHQYFGMPDGTELITPIDLEKEKELIRILNKARIAKGMQPLIWNEGLSYAARYHAYDMATQNYFKHATYDIIDNHLEKIGGTFVRIRKFHKTGANSENIAAGSEGSLATYQQWFNSPGHYKNMFNPISRYVGIGMYYSNKSTFKHYWAFCTSTR